jgi:hypothetical protein
MYGHTYFLYNEANADGITWKSTSTRGGKVGGGSELKTGLTLNDDIYHSVSDGTADVADVVYVNMSLDLWGVLGWVKQQEENS